ncbi:MAG: KAP family NTPase [Prevotellaceae bacterium]|jgi:hypothetical protein|nr:KAP family NTPase [Prevotellaceae bacterium]
MTKDNEKIIYPRFIPNKPCGIDKFEGKSQKRLTTAIAKHIISNDNNSKQNLSRIIGLEGGWGVGKSNVIKQLKQHNDIKDIYYLFEYDAWGHQEDLQRRSFLEILTTKLIQKNILSGSTEIKIKDGGTKKVTWDEKLKYLLARKTETSTEKHPKLSIGIIAFVLAAIFTSVFASIADTIKDDCLIFSIILPFIPFVIAAIVVLIILHRKNKKWKDIFNEIFSIYSGKIENEISYETISEEEPTVTEFKSWMQSISEHIGKQKKKLIIVYDNMDRLPADKVKELWSSIHTFFSEEGFANVWAIIPFDEKHLSCAFGESENKEQLTKYFISKTFPIVYQVTPPIITDFKGMFNTLWEEAFGNTKDEQKDEINRIFRLEKPNATVREMIEFINHLVALKNTWLDEIDILFIAIFALKKDILQTPVEQIPSGSYLGAYIPNIIPNDELLQKSISALVYGVSIDKAEQIPMSKYIDSCFNLEENADVNKFKSSNSFIHILNDKIKNSDIAQLDNIIQCLSKLDSSSLTEDNQQTITTLWKTLAQRKMKLPLAKQEFDNNYKLLILNTDETHKQNIVKRLCKQIQSFKEFNSKNYYNALKEMDEFLQANNIDVKVVDNLEKSEKEPKTFIEYVLYTKENYQQYKLSANADKLDDYLRNVGIKEKQSDLEVLKYLIDDNKYKFDETKEYIKTHILSDYNIVAEHFKSFFDAYKVLSKEKPLEVQLNPNQRQNIWKALASKPNTPEFLEIVTIQIANGINTGGTFNEEQIKYIAENLDYYASYGDLLINNLSWDIPHLAQALKYMTENKLGNTLSLEQVIPKFFNIKNTLVVTEIVLLDQLNNWEKYKDAITTSNIQQVIPDAQFFQFSKVTKNDLTDYLNTTIIERLSKITTDQLYQFRQSQPQNYWLLVLNTLIDTDFIKPLPDNLTELGKRYLDDIAASRLVVPNANDIVYKLIEKLDKRKTAAHIKDIRDKYCNSQYNINAQLFLYFESWFENQGDLKQVANRTTHKIIEPVINDTNCLSKIISKSDYYATIINAAGDDATTLKTTISNKVQKSNDSNLFAFAEKIGITKETKKNQ